MAGSKKINLGKFFRQDSATTSGVRVVDDKGINPQAEVVLSGRNLSEILGIIQTTTEIDQGQKQLIEVEDRNDNALQGLVNTLQQRLFGLQSSLFSLKSEFQNYLLSSKRLEAKKTREKYAQFAEDTKQRSSATASPQQNLIDTFVPPSYQDGSSGGEIGTGSALAGAALGGAAAVFSNMLQDGENTDENIEPPPNTGSYDAEKLTQLAKSVGMPEDKIPQMVAIALAESGGDPSGHYTPEESGGTDDSYGLWQINMIGSLGPARIKEFGLKSKADLFDPVVNARAAKKVLEGSGFTAWSTYGTPKYNNFLKDIQNKEASKTDPEKSSKPSTTANPSQTPQASISPSQTTNISSTTTAQATQISAAPSQTAEEIAKEEQMMASASQIEPQKEEKSTADLAQPDSDVGAAPPVIIPVNNAQSATQDMQVSSGDSIPGGVTENFNNFYPSLSRAVLGIMV